MEFFYLSLALLTAGACLLSGTINFVGGLYKGGDRTELIFGLLSFTAFFFLVIPPMGFIVTDIAPYSPSILVKRMFIWGYYMTLPWFIEYYSGYKRRIFNYLVIGTALVSYFVMFSTTTDRSTWFYLSRVPLVILLYYGISAALYQRKTPKKSESKWLMAAMIIYGTLLILSILNQIFPNVLLNGPDRRVFFPLHLNLIAFLVIMSVRIRANTHEKYLLEKKLHQQDARWNQLMENVELIIIEMDPKGTINYVNSYALKKLGWSDENNIVGQNWFEQLIPRSEQVALKSQFAIAFQSTSIPGNFTSKVKLKNGQKELLISWTNVFVYDQTDQPNGIICIGADNSELIKAFEQIDVLKNELEKENIILRGEKIVGQQEKDILGDSDVILTAIQKARHVAKTNAGVLLLGETGSGKELFAELVHRNSYRTTHSFVKVNCAALPADLIESELFGHEKGSFTGAINSRIGKFEMANGGSIFLDEIGELPLQLQSKLLRVLQGGEFQRIGGHQNIKVDVRVIAATNRNLLNEVKAGRFREDLYYRLNVFPIQIPALRERKSDIPQLVSYFVKKFCSEQNKTIQDVSKADLQALTRYEWPGNIRELINLLERSVITSSGPTLHLDWETNGLSNGNQNHDHQSLEDIEKAYVLKILQECRWKINGEDGAAVRLGINPSTLRSRMKKLQIERERI